MDRILFPGMDRQSGGLGGHCPAGWDWTWADWLPPCRQFNLFQTSVAGGGQFPCGPLDGQTGLTPFYYPHTCLYQAGFAFSILPLCGRQLVQRALPHVSPVVSHLQTFTHLPPGPTTFPCRHLPVFTPRQHADTPTTWPGTFVILSLGWFLVASTPTFFPGQDIPTSLPSFLCFCFLPVLPYVSSSSLPFPPSPTPHSYPISDFTVILETLHTLWTRPFSLSPFPFHHLVAGVVADTHSSHL